MAYPVAISTAGAPRNERASEKERERGKGRGRESKGSVRKQKYAHNSKAGAAN